MAPAIRGSVAPRVESAFFVARADACLDVCGSSATCGCEQWLKPPTPVEVDHAARRHGAEHDSIAFSILVWTWSSSMIESFLCSSSGCRLSTCRGLCRELGEAEGERERERERELAELRSAGPWASSSQESHRQATTWRHGGLGSQSGDFWRFLRRYMEIFPRLRETMRGFSDYETYPRPLIAPGEPAVAPPHFPRQRRPAAQGANGRSSPNSKRQFA